MGILETQGDIPTQTLAQERYHGALIPYLHTPTEQLRAVLEEKIDEYVYTYTRDSQPRKKRELLQTLARLCANNQVYWHSIILEASALFARDTELKQLFLEGAEKRGIKIRLSFFKKKNKSRP